MIPFKSDNSYDFRRQLYEKIHNAYPDCYPVIIERQNRQDPEILKHKFLVPNMSTMILIIREARNHMNLNSPEDCIIFYVDGKLIPVSYLIDDVYEKYHDKDGFLYLTYTTESTFG